jgi:DNA polymerase-3 subunit gamma/tau
MYQALYRKWRPVVFEDVLGQPHITATIKNQLTGGKLSHAYLFSGTRGTGKTSTAKIFARAVNCEAPAGGNPCNKCHACLSALNGSAVDIIEIDAASNNKVDDARVIRDEVIYAPAELKYKVYIIDEAHMLTNQAFNALLKTLEEPPPHIIFIFATTEPHKFPPTILSRCQRFDFKRITPYDTEKRIRQIIENGGYSISADAVSLLCRIADGSMRDALSVLDQCLSSGKTEIDFADIAEVTGASDPAFIYSFSDRLISGDMAGGFGAVKDAYENGRDLERVLEDLTAHFRNVLIAKTLDGEKQAIDILSVTGDAYAVYRRQADALSVERILRYIDILCEASLSQKYAANPRLCAEIAVTGMVKEPDGFSREGIFERINELEIRLARVESVGYRAQSAEAAKPAVVPSAEKKAEMPPPVSDDFVPPLAGCYMEPEYGEEPPGADIYAREKTAMPPPETEKAPLAPAPPSVADRPEGEKAAMPPAQWDAIIDKAAEKADFGLKGIISGAEVDFGDNLITISFDKEIHLNIAKMNKYDAIIKNAAEAVTGKPVSVKIVPAKNGETPKNDNNYDYLIKKLENYSEHMENISVFD